jgi:hypothetical protein
MMALRRQGLLPTSPFGGEVGLRSNSGEGASSLPADPIVRGAPIKAPLTRREAPTSPPRGEVGTGPRN